MSAFLGPIHHMLFEKIKFQNTFTDKLLNAYGNGRIYEDVLNNTEDIPKGQLEDIIDQSNIHGSLQEMIAKVEYRLAYVLYLLKKEKGFSLDEAVDLAKEYGMRTREAELGENKFYTAIEAYTMVSGKLLNGMPCDRIQEILDKDEAAVLWQDRLDIHKKYWDAAKSDIRDFYKIRGAMIAGLIGENFNYNEVEPYKFQIVRTN
ncbi:MAG: hypothetical protein PUK21_06465 [Peptostreptococcaceae bacterium]|nr:hypothetical protein [Peptostreptococcaceae bacterium]MDY5738742.1 hypothetical protein [Anaerovoracaceae bacterium]